MNDKILIVDDEPEIADLIEVYLQNENYTVFKFYSAQEAGTGGAGFGLSIAKEIVGMHSGTISAQSANDSVIFTVWLPIVI